MLDTLIIISLAVVLIILISGVVVMARGGETARKYSNRLMQARVAAQFAAVILIALLLFTSGD
ncbi:MAG: twin transmembrane helix small protein [Sphingomonadales bacterium]